MILNEPTTVRGQLLNEARQLTEGDRAATYGNPTHNLETTNALFRTLLCAAERSIGEAECEALHYMCGKLARYVCCKTIHKDSVVDGCAYLAIAYEEAKKYEALKKGRQDATE